jgi:hypothetical protein
MMLQAYLGECQSMATEMKQTFVALAGNGILRLGQVEDCGAVIEHDGIPCSCEEIFYPYAPGPQGSWLECLHIHEPAACEV